jgi:hypothetical protein
MDIGLNISYLLESLAHGYERNLRRQRKRQNAISYR